MMKLGIIVVVVLLLLAAGGFAVYYFWFHEPEPAVTKSGKEVDVPVNPGGEDVLGDLSAPGPGAEPDFAFTGEEDAGSRDIAIPGVEAEVGTGDSAATEGIVDLSPGTTDAGTTDVGDVGLAGVPPTGDDVFFPPETPETGTNVPVVEPTATPRPERTSEANTITPVVEPTATPKPATSTVASTSTPTPAPTAPPVAGHFSVKTLAPVLGSKLPAIRTAMKKLGVTLKEEKAGQQQRIQGYRVAIGYFRTQAEANSWAVNYLKPKGIDYFVYPARNMYSIQVGVYTERQNVEQQVRALYQKFPGWRLPVRTEPYAFAKSTYHLSLSKIAESLGRRIQDTLFRMGVQAELAGA